MRFRNLAYAGKASDKGQDAKRTSNIPTLRDQRIFKRVYDYEVLGPLGLQQNSIPEALTWTGSYWIYLSLVRPKVPDVNTHPLRNLP